MAGKRSRDDDIAEEVEEIYNNFAKADRKKLIRKLVLREPGSLYGLEKCECCGKIVLSECFNKDVESYSNTTIDICDDCCYYCKTCNVKYSSDADYKHEACKTCVLKDKDVTSDEDEEDNKEEEKEVIDLTGLSDTDEEKAAEKESGSDAPK